MTLLSTTLDVDTLDEAQRTYHANGWTDGLPVIPPTPERVEACLSWAMLAPEHLVGIEPVRARALTAEKLAVNAVMAGCSPEHFPVVVTALTAMLQPEFKLHGPTASTGGAGVLLIVNGPIRRELGLGGEFSPLGGTSAAANVIGRAVRLTLINVFDIRPGGTDRSTLGHPGKLTYCIAEDEEGSPWPSLATRRLGDPHVSAVTAVASLAPRQIMNEWTSDPADICATIAAEMRANQLSYSIWPGNYTVLLPPQLRAHFEAARWSAARVCETIAERAKVRRAEWANVGKQAVVKDKGDRVYEAVESPDDILLVAAGGPAGGFASVIPPWLGTRSRAVTVPVGACVDCDVP